MPAKSPDPDLLVINTIRTLSMDAVQAANSGHPGTPTGERSVMTELALYYTIKDGKIVHEQFYYHVPGA